MNTADTTLPPSVEGALEALVENLRHAEPLLHYYQAKTRLDANAEARQLLAEFSTAQAALRFKQSRGQLVQADVDRLRALQRKVQTNHAIRDYAETQQAASAYLPLVNQEISELLGLDFAALAGPANC
jgi:cell fate (sporulation/competence/biofilm development) regulator YlbF (YheA/YmcA/DUF963 family)